MDRMLTELETTPLAQRAREAILEAILTHRFDGDRLPAEDELARMLSVSRTTIRTALHSLEQEGLITRRRAVGTTINRHVRPSTLALQRLIGFDFLLSDKGHEVKVDQSWSRGKPPADMMTALGLTDLDDCLLTEKSYYADGALAIYVRDIMPWSQITQELPETLDASLFEFSQRYTSTPIDHAVAELVPVVKRSDKTTQIGVKRGGAFLRLLETHYLKVGEPVAYSLIDIDDAYVRLEIFRRR